MDVFNGLGCFSEKITFKLKEGAIPKLCPPRRVPFKICNKLRETLDRMCQMKIIIKCDEPNKWQSNIIIVEKSDKSIRVCLDPIKLNKYIVQERYEISILEQIKLSLIDKKYFTR